MAHDAPAHGRSTGRFASLPEFARALRAVADQVGEVYGLVGHSLGGAAACVAMHAGLQALRVVIVAPPAQLTTDMKKVGDTMLKEWLEKAGAEGQAIVDAYKKM